MRMRSSPPLISTPTEEELMRHVLSVCLCVCLSVSRINKKKSCIQIRMKFPGRYPIGDKAKMLNF